MAPAARRPGGRKIASDLEAECRAVRGRFADLVGPPDREREEAIWELFFGLKFERAEPMASKVDEKLLMVSPRPPRLGLCILAGRRRFLHDAGAARLWEDFSRRSHPIEIRTYDSLVERLGFVSD